MSKTLREAITQLIKDDFRNPDAEVKDLKVSFTIVERTEQTFNMEDDKPKDKPQGRSGANRGKKKGNRRGRIKGSKNKSKKEEPAGQSLLQ